MVRRIDRDGASLRVVTDRVEGLRLPDLLQAAIGAPLRAAAALELAAQVVRTVARLHQKPGLAHGAITPAHVVITGDARVVLTDGVFGGALEALRWNREQLWGAFGVAMPASASLPRFDVRSDVTQLGATVLAIMMGRLMRTGEYPRPVPDLINATTATGLAGPDSTFSRLRVWLYQALQLHPRENFDSAVEAERAFDDVIGVPSSRRAGTLAFPGIRGPRSAEQDLRPSIHTN